MVVQTIIELKEGMSMLKIVVLGVVILFCPNFFRYEQPAAQTRSSQSYLERFEQDIALLRAEILHSASSLSECDSAELRSFEERISVIEFIGNGVIAVERRFTLRVNSNIASTHNELGSYAFRRGCLEDARRIFLYVIEIYVGSGYAAIRQRAQIGIDDVRAAAKTR